MKKIILAGGSGFLGTTLANYFSKRNCEVIILSRQAKEKTHNIRTVLWNAKTFGLWCNELEGAEALINLTGKSVDCRYTEKNEKLIYSSRLDSTNVIGQAIQQCVNPPKVWINAGSATIYRSSFDKAMTESDGEIGNDFSMDVCKKWEATFNQYELKKTRKAIIRTSIVLGNNGGAFGPLKTLTKLYFGGRQGTGKQYVSWLHVKDFCNIVDWIINHPSASGAYNTTAPNPVTNKAFMAELRRSLRVPFGVPLPEPLLKWGAMIARTETELLLKSRSVIPERLMHEGFTFQYATIKDALNDLTK